MENSKKLNPIGRKKTFKTEIQLKLTHDEEMQHCDENPGQLECLRGQQETRVDLEPVDDGQVAPGQQLEAEEEGGEGVGDDQRQHEGYVGRLVLKVRIFDMSGQFSGEQ